VTRTIAPDGSQAWLVDCTNAPASACDVEARRLCPEGHRRITVKGTGFIITCRQWEDAPTASPAIATSADRGVERAAQTPTVTSASGSTVRELAAGASSAQTVSPAESQTAQSGPYVGITVGFGYGSGEHTYPPPTFVTSSYGPSRTFQGVAIDAGVAVGYWLVPRLACSFEAGIFAYPEIQSVGARSLVIWRLGVLVDAYPSSAFPLHIQAGVGYGHGAWSGRPADWGLSVAIDLEEDPVGWFGHVGLGLAWPVAGFQLGPLLGVYYAGLHTDRTDTTANGFELTLAGTSF
jgi:hypothetical protein